MDPHAETASMDDAGEWIPQAASIPWRDGKVCLVRSRSGRRWVIPKGNIDPGHTAGEAALIEAWEEAGLVGHLQGTAIGSFVYTKFSRDHHVTVFVMNVTHEAFDFPERLFRSKEWLDPEVAAQRVTDPGLRELILAVAERNLTMSQ
jgi:8-oxo-dGTP pyrophosphatase MutT (NUDIX family)